MAHFFDFRALSASWRFGFSIFYVSRIRRKLGRDFIRTIRGLGYRLGD
jgi:hypothetical protein